MDINDKVVYRKNNFILLKKRQEKGKNSCYISVSKTNPGVWVWESQLTKVVSQEEEPQIY